MSIKLDGFILNRLGKRYCSVCGQLVGEMFINPDKTDCTGQSPALDFKVIKPISFKKLGYVCKECAGELKRK